MGNIIDLTNNKFGRLLVLRFSHKDKHHKAHWYCKCDCGNTKVIAGSSLRRGLSKSCGCVLVELLKSNNKRKQVSEHNKKFRKWAGAKNPGYGKTGNKNVSNRSEVRKKISNSKLGDKNPSKKFEVRKKISESMKGKFIGEKAWNWKGGISSDRDKLRQTFEYKEWRKSVFKRDSYTCQKCNKKKSGKLQAHHIKSFDNNKDLIIDICNGITLCINCHKEFHTKFGYGNNTNKHLNKFLGEYNDI